MASINVKVMDASQISNFEFKMYNVLGEEIMNTTVTAQSTNLKTTNMPSGIYFYNVISNNKIVQSGKLVSQQ
jgi:hypothetical protein